MKKRLLALLLAAVLMFTFTGCKNKGGSGESARHALPQMNLPQDGDTVVLIETSEGSISAVLYEDLAPKACQNFIALADSGYYDGLLIHKVLADFVIQTGDPTLTGTGGEAANGTGIQPEYVERLHHFTGALGMASDEHGGAQSQCYIV
ncbi:MAG: peptidylprolyl isomerase, partial [Oscillospiraceae bacterium]|nr:peptidylprolyl isomerase [Oscillospiraceae bacterium]